ncbi:membrane anchored protein in chemotaxis locus [Shewanella sp. SG41-3]|uniref:membrane anchored protein in chemotaxis locus n=1 Tax=Shewanella sp. SG41-3 TaxID=2760977 RepID=UPI0028735922|nr:membrane anchored protein in chemotaxis locus [Shewanella sp. SG41-3]
MAKSSYSLQTKHMLGFFLCFIAILVLAGLYVDANKKITLLKQDVARLTDSQVLLMVPEEQAANIANWLTQHPEQTQAIVASAGQEQAKSVLFGPGALDDDQPTKLKHPEVVSEGNNQEIIVSEDAQGVKVIRLPNGGIRVTTRDDTQHKQ